tara:strand:+ start:3705 stop:3983 length:279 start_codon:yes stop_codon:yes gene_type:complete
MEKFNLSTQPKFVNEWKKFTAGLKQVENEEYAYQINILMEELKDLVAKIDVGHDADFNGYINPHGLVETRHKIQEVRHQIFQKFQEMGITVR